MKALILASVTCITLTVPALAQPPRDTAPASQPPRDLVLPPVIKAKLSNGMTAWIVERHQVPVVEVSVLLPAGAERDPKGKYGVASFTANLLEEGAGGRTSLEIADELDFLGAEVSASSDYDGTAVDLHVPVARLQPALDLLRTIVAEPDFPEAEIERRRTELLTEFMQVRDDPNGLMALVFPSVLYPTTHRYGTMTSGTESVVEGLTKADLQSFHDGAYRPENSAILVVGDVKTPEMIAKLEKTFGSWKGKGQALPLPAMPAVSQVKGRRIVLVDKPGAAQTVIRIARLGVDRKTPDFYTLQVLNTILGGSFTSRLNQNLREDHGYTYGARSAFQMRHDAGPFFASANVQTDKTGPALVEFFKELEAIRKQVGAEELAKAKSYLAYSYPAGFLTTAEFAGELGDVWTYDLDEGFLTDYVDRILAVTAEDVERAAQQTIVPDDMVIVMVGDRAAILPQIESLKLGEITLAKP